MTANRCCSRRAVAAALAALVVSLAAASVASADTATITVTAPGGEQDPVAGVRRTFTVAGSTAADQVLYVKHRAAGGVACATSPDTDPGQYFTTFTGRRSSGNFSYTRQIIWPTSGSELFCLWLVPTSDAVSAPIAQTITFRAPTGAIAATVNPVAGWPGMAAQVLITGTSEARREVFAAVQSLAVACAPTYTADPGSPLTIRGATQVQGAFTLTGTIHLGSAGHYQVCLWLASTSTDPTPVVGPQAIPFDVAPAPAKVSTASVLNCPSAPRPSTLGSRRPSACATTSASSRSPGRS